MRLVSVAFSDKCSFLGVQMSQEKVRSFLTQRRATKFRPAHELCAYHLPLMGVGKLLCRPLEKRHESEVPCEMLPTSLAWPRL